MTNHPVKPLIAWDRYDKPILMCQDGSLHWLTLSERFMMWLGCENIHSLNRKYVQKEPVTMTDNPFLRLADAQMSGTAKARHKRREVKVVKSEHDAPMKPSELMQKLEDQNKQVRMYRAWKKAEFDHMLTVHGEQWKMFIDTAKHLNAENTNLFLDKLDWLLDEDLTTRQVALAYIANHLINLRLSQGLSPIDDSLPGEEPTLFEIIREKLGVMTP